MLGVMAGAFIGIGAASASAASHAITDAGVAKVTAGIVFPIGLMMIVFIGGELFTGDTMMIMGALDKRYSVGTMLKTLLLVYFSNMVGGCLIAFLVTHCGQLDYSSGALGAFTIKVAVGKVTIPFARAFFSGILCNILVCVAVLMSMAAKDMTGKIFAIVFPIFAFVVGGYEHCVANMYYIPAGIMAAANETYAAKAAELYGYSSAQLSQLNVGNFLLANLLPVTLGNIVGGMVCVALPLYMMHKKKA
jgi:formate/nitrite transporter